MRDGLFTSAPDRRVKRSWKTLADNNLVVPCRAAAQIGLWTALSNLMEPAVGQPASPETRSPIWTQQLAGLQVQLGETTLTARSRPPSRDRKAPLHGSPRRPTTMDSLDAIPGGEGQAEWTGATRSAVNLTVEPHRN